MELKELVRIDYCNQRVLTSAQLANRYGITPNVIKENYRRAKEYFVEGEDYFKVSGAALRELKERFKRVKKFDPLSPIPKMASCLYLWTHKGCVHHCKMINTPQAWKMFNELERVYFGVLEGEITLPTGTRESVEEEPPIAQVDKAALLCRIQKQFARPCSEFAIVYALLMSNLIVKIGYTTNSTERIKKIKAETKLEVIDYYSSRLMPLEAARALEARLKEKYAADCIEGEYYDVRFVDVCEEI